MVGENKQRNLCELAFGCVRLISLSINKLTVVRN